MDNGDAAKVKQTGEFQWRTQKFQFDDDKKSSDDFAVKKQRRERKSEEGIGDREFGDRFGPPSNEYGIGHNRIEFIYKFFPPSSSL